MKKLSLIFAIAFLALLSCRQEKPLVCQINEMKRPVVVTGVVHYSTNQEVYSVILKDSNGDLHDFYNRTADFTALFNNSKVGDTLR